MVPESNGNDGVLRIPKDPEGQPVYSTAPADWANFIIGRSIENKDVEKQSFKIFSGKTSHFFLNVESKKLPSR